MSNKRITVWILIALAGMPLSGLPFLMQHLASGFSLPELSRMLEFPLYVLRFCYPPYVMDWKYIDARVHEWGVVVNPLSVLAALCLALLAWSVYCWIKKPLRRNLLLMLFCGWALCGFPTQFLFMLSQARTHGDAMPPPGNYDTVLLDGMCLGLYPDKERHNPNVPSGYDEILPDGRRFYVVPWTCR